MITHPAQRPLAALVTLALTASFALIAICTPAPLQPKTQRVHAAAPSLVLM